MGVFHLKSDHFRDIYFTRVGMLSFSWQTFVARIFSVNTETLQAEILSFELMYYGTFYDKY